MASSSMLCTEEELQRARDELRELLARSPIPDEFKSPPTSDDDEEVEKVGKKEKKKKKKYVLPQQEVETLLNWEFSNLSTRENLDPVEGADEELLEEARTLLRVADVFIRADRDFIRSFQEKLRHDYETNGYITYEATDDEEEGAEEDGGDRPPKVRGLGI